MTDSSRRGLQSLAVAVGLAAAAGIAVLYRINPPRAAPGSRTDKAGRPAVASQSATTKRAAVESYLRRRANDPDSVRIQTVRYGITPETGGQLVYVEFREKNDAGATVFRTMVLTLQPGGDVTQEDRYLSVVNQYPWSDDPAGP